MVSGACAGTYGAKLTIVKGDGEPESSSFECGSTLDRFVRHDGGPITISAVPPSGKPAATGVKVQTNPDCRASELEICPSGRRSSCSRGCPASFPAPTAETPPARRP